jgi:hypothetical protein
MLIFACEEGMLTLMPQLVRQAWTAAEAQNSSELLIHLVRMNCSS